MRLLVGLGNPGSRYEKTRHNVGFAAVDRLLEVSGGRWTAATDEGVGAEIVLEGRPLTLLKPLTFMNLSGRAVAAAAGAKNLERRDVMVIFDDVWLPLGTLRLRERGSAGGHNGLASVIDALGGEDVPRLRIGIRSDQTCEGLADFVLSPFDENELEIVDTTLDRVVEATRAVLTEGMPRAMSRFNRPPIEGGRLA